MGEIKLINVLMWVENNAVPFDKRVWREALTLSENGHRVRIVGPKDSENTKKFEIIDKVEIFRYSIHFARRSRLGFIFEYAYSYWATFFISLWLFIFKGGFKIIHASNPPDMYWFAACFFKIFGVKFIFDEHDLSPEVYLSKFSKKKTLHTKCCVSRKNFLIKLPTQ